MMILLLLKHRDATSSYEDIWNIDWEQTRAVAGEDEWIPFSVLDCEDGHCNTEKLLLPQMKV